MTMDAAKPPDRCSLLYVGNDPALVSAAAKLLGKGGLLLRVAENGRDGVRIFAEEQPGIVIAEIDLPGMDGLAMIRQLRICNPRLQAIIVSADPACEQLIEAINLGVNFFLRKPVNIVQLKAALDRSLHNVCHGRPLPASPVAEGGQGSDDEAALPSSFVDSRPRGGCEDLLMINAELECRLLRRSALLEAAEKELEDFCDAISHDLRGPISRLQGFSHVLLDDCADRLGSEERLYLERIDQTSRQLKKILDALIDLSQLTRKQLLMQKVDLSSIAGDFARHLKNMEPRRDVTFVIAPGGMVNGDLGLLRIAMVNLLGNAWKFTSRRECARIEFGITPADGGGVFYVRDNGMGFDMGSAGKLFKPFHRIHNDEGFSGVGVGLAAVQRIVKRHGGRIWAEAEEGKGATFYFTLER